MSESYQPASARDEFVRGVRRGIPVLVASAPFGFLFGAVAIDNGLSVLEATILSATIFAGASQMVGVDLFGKHVDAWIIVLSIFAVNFRHVLYSAALGRRLSSWPGPAKALAFFFLVDPAFAESEQRLQRGLPVTFPWFMGLALSVYVSWVLISYVGAEFGSRLMPDTHALGLDFLLPIYFLGLVMGFRERPRWLPVVAVSAIVSVAAFFLIGSPWHVSIGGLAGVLLAAALPPEPAETIDRAADESAEERLM